MNHSPDPELPTAGVSWSNRVVPFHRLPPGYERTLFGHGGSPTTPKPAATLILLRSGRRGLEVLLLKRSLRTRFIPGAYVFPGGRVDPDDSSPRLLAQVDTSSTRDARSLLLATPGAPSGIAYPIAALRETFEETGILLERASEIPRSVPMEGREPASLLRRELHQGRRGFSSVLDQLEATLGVSQVTYVGHWTTPVQERYRYDTRFFATEVPSTCSAFPDGVEMVESLWLTPSEALERNRQGLLPLVIPTMVTLESLEPFDSPDTALKTLGGQEVSRLLPRVEVIEDGVGVTLERREPEAQSDS